LLGLVLINIAAVCISELPWRFFCIWGAREG